MVLSVVLLEINIDQYITRSLLSEDNKELTWSCMQLNILGVPFSFYIWIL